MECTGSVDSSSWGELSFVPLRPGDKMADVRHCGLILRMAACVVSGPTCRKCRCLVFEVAQPRVEWSRQQSKSSSRELVGVVEDARLASSKCLARVLFLDFRSRLATLAKKLTAGQ